MKIIDWINELLNIDIKIINNYNNNLYIDIESKKTNKIKLFYLFLIPNEIFLKYPLKKFWLYALEDVYFINIIKERPYLIDNYCCLTYIQLNFILIQKHNSEKIDLEKESENLFLDKNDIKILEENKDKINWLLLSLNPYAIPILIKYKEKIDWNSFSKNRKAINILEKNINKIDFINLMKNKGIFEYDYITMKESFKELKEEIIKKSLHPIRISQWLESGMDIDYL